MSYDYFSYPLVRHILSTTFFHKVKPLIYPYLQLFSCIIIQHIDIFNISSYKKEIKSIAYHITGEDVT